MPDKVKTMSKFYNMTVDDFRGETKFNIYLLTDYNPIYDFRKTSKGKRLVNTKLFDLKQNLRNNDYSIHGTDNIQETKDNLRVLNLFEKYYKQKRFDSLSDVFDVLNNNSELKWVVMRNFEDMPNNIHIDEHLDVDLLVNDYYLIKRLLDASSATNNRFEDGKHRILNHVIINNKKVLFDFRCVGDNYYDINFQKNMLRTRVKHKNFYIPNKSNHLYGLIYHAIIHKNKISNSYKKIFIKNNISYDKNNLKKLLDIFMINNNYNYVKPEPSVGFNYTYVKPEPFVGFNYNAKTCVITVVSGNYKAHIRSIDHLNIDGFIFTNSVSNIKIDGSSWNIVNTNYYTHSDPYMIPKYYKTQWHKIPELKKYDVIVWMDSTIEIKTLPPIHYNYDIIIHKALSGRTMPIQAIKAGYNDIRWKNYKNGLEKQMKLYSNTKWYANTAFFIAKRNKAVIKMNDLWFSHNLKYSPYCQLSFPWACDETGVRVLLQTWNKTAIIKHPHLISYKDYYK